MNDEVLAYDSVKICLQRKTTAENISFSLKQGEILGIVGESGSGKSTLLKAAMGFLGDGGAVVQGHIWFQGKNLPQLAEKEMQRIRGTGIGMIFQDAKSSFCPVRTIGAQICESLNCKCGWSKKETKVKAMELFEKLEFGEGERIWNSFPFALSGGMNQRAAIAAAMLLNPSVLLADEPTSALDALVQQQTVTELLRLRQLFGTSILLVTHDMGVVRAMADKILVLKEGKQVEYGPAEQILSYPQKDYTKALLEAEFRIQRSEKDGTDVGSKEPERGI